MVAHQPRRVVAEAGRLGPCSSTIGTADVEYVRTVGGNGAIVCPGDVEVAVVGVYGGAQYGVEAKVVAEAYGAVGLVSRSDCRAIAPRRPAVCGLHELDCACITRTPV